MPKGTYERKQKDFICNRCKKIYQAYVQRKEKGFCKKCRAIMKIERKRKRKPNLPRKYYTRRRLKQILEVGNKCAICKTPVIFNEKTLKFNMRFIIHHINYKKETTVLLCSSCHCWLHGNCPAYVHPFKEKYGDEAPFHFAMEVVKLYLNKDPQMQEVIKYNLKKD